MKILLTIGDVSITGGAERVAVNLANAFSALGHTVTLLSFFRTKESLPYALDSKVKLHYYHTFSESTLNARYQRHLLAKIYYKNLYKIILNYRIYRTFSDFDAVICNDSTFMPLFSHKNTRYVRILHVRFHRYEARNRLFDSLVMLSHKEFTIWQGYHKHIQVIPNFLPHLPKKRTNTMQKQIISIGRMDKGDQKGFLRLLDIWAKVRDSISSNYPHLSAWQLVIVGDGAIKPDIQSAIKTLCLTDSVRLKPFTKDIESAYMSASIYAMCSVYEGFGMVLIEAGSYALPCVAFDVRSGPSDIIEDSVSGYLIADNDYQAYAKALIHLMDDNKKREAMGLAAQNRVEKYFSKDAIMPLWEQLLEQK